MNRHGIKIKILYLHKTCTIYTTIVTHANLNLLGEKMFAWWESWSIFSLRDRVWGYKEDSDDEHVSENSQIESEAEAEADAQADADAV